MFTPSTRKNRHRAATLIAAALCAGLVLSAGIAAAEPTDPGTRSTPAQSETVSPEIDAFIRQMGPEFLNNQWTLSDLAGWIREQPNFADRGYIGQVNYAETLSTKLLWHGNDDRFLQEVLDHAASLGISASVEHRAMSMQQIDEAMDRIWAEADTYRAAGFELGSIAGVGEEDTGLIVSGTYQGSLAAVPGRAVPQSTLSARSSLAESITGTARAPITVVEGGVGGPTTTRSTDRTPFRAGGYMVSSDNGKCSTGFGLKLGSQTYATTAYHCQGSSWMSYDKVASYGGHYKDATGTNSRASLLNSRAAGYMFDGTWDNAAGYNKPVAGFKDLSVGDWVCTSGGNSGVHCTIQVTNLNQKKDDGWGQINVIGAIQRTAGQIAAIQGDSGGPVLYVNGNGSVGAAGMIQVYLDSGMTGSSCGSVHESSGYNSKGTFFNYFCSVTVGFTSMRTIANELGATLITI